MYRLLVLLLLGATSPCFGQLARNSTPESLLDRGYLPLGYDPGGNIVFLDTHSSDGLQVSLYYFPRLSEGVKEKYIYRSGMSLVPFLEWVYSEPRAFRDCWDNHFSK
jgi:hypothetical protein